MPKIIIVSNRLPFTAAHADGGFSYLPNSGGLFSALKQYLDLQSEQGRPKCVWVGWPGTEIPLDQRGNFSRQVMEDHSVHPVMVPPGLMALAYHGFCGKTLWPLFHYFPSHVEYDEDLWDAYKSVNTIFRDAVLEIIEPNDFVWIHDYHLMLLPQMLRHEVPGIPSGFFMHIPFPNFEIFRLLPPQWRVEILEGMLGADLVGFQTHDYTQYFLRSVFRTLGYEHNLGNIFMEERVARADTFPLGVDFEKFSGAAKDPGVLKEMEELSERFEGKRLIFSLERMDYSNGTIQKLRGYHCFLERNPEWRGKVVFLFCIAPGRGELERDPGMKKEIDELVGNINGAFGNLNWNPIVYQYRGLSWEAQTALYVAADVALLTPLRDGMNLIAKEFVASRSNGNGVLILSEMAGAANDLGEAVIVNPNHRDEIAKALSEALAMPEEVQWARIKIMQERLKRYDTLNWALGFEAAVKEVGDLQKSLQARHLARAARREIVSRFKKAGKRLILLDYDGTLVPFASSPVEAVPDTGVMQMLKKLAYLPTNFVYIVSGRTRQTMMEWFKGLGVGLIAEHGMWIGEGEGDWKMVKRVEIDWKPKLQPMLEMAVDRLPGSFVEDKEFSIAWHYRNANPEMGKQRAKELMDSLVRYTANLDVQVLEGKKVIELRGAGVNKGAAALYCKDRIKPDFTLAVGDDLTDEDLFRALPKDHTIRVGMRPSYAGHNLKDYLEVREFLEELM